MVPWLVFRDFQRLYMVNSQYNPAVYIYVGYT